MGKIQPFDETATCFHTGKAHLESSSWILLNGWECQREVCCLHRAFEVAFYWQGCVIFIIIFLKAGAILCSSSPQSCSLHSPFLTLSHRVCLLMLSLYYVFNKVHENELETLISVLWECRCKICSKCQFHYILM